MKKRILSLSLAVLLLLTCFSGCAKEPGTNDGGPATEPALCTVVADKYIVRDGKSDYVLVLPEKPLELETLAAEEFNTFLQMATGCTLDIVSEKNVSEGAKYISIGGTRQFADTFGTVEADLKEIAGKQSSYYIGTKGDCIYIAAGSGFRGAGALYGVYDLLHELVGYTYYWDTEIYVDKLSDVNLRDYPLNLISPSFDARTHSTNYIYGNPTHNYRLRYVNFSWGPEWNRTTSGHSQLQKFLHPTDTDENGVPYGETHPEWFVNPHETKKAIQTNQLCWTAGGDAESLKEMQQVIANQMINYLQMDDIANFFMFGQHDNSDACTCAGCKAALDEWAGSMAGLQIGFFNGILDLVEAWRTENQPDREVFYVVYAYHFTQTAPVKKDGEGNLEPYSDRVIPNSRMRIFYAPVTANYAFTFDSPVNDDVYQDLQGWKTVCSDGQLFAYLYDLYTSNYFTNFYNFSTLQSTAKELEEAGVTFYLNQGASDQKNVPGFQELRGYVTSNIMWDTDRNYQELAADFITHYYKDAAAQMQEVFDMICDQCIYYSYTVNYGLSTINAYPEMTKLYPRAFTEKLDDVFGLAFDAIAELESSDPELYETLYTRIMKEYLCVIYLKGVVYGDYYSEEEVNEMREIWNYYIQYWDMKNGGEGSPLPTF